ncbi:acyl-CoA dehydratase activase-related protein [Pelotomaculum propionicicum]|uniref:acyl-CoA dehydratase activase-related protein n=1 Tax=Pelotomaculum propionicicum TaxID=258475 RepID=UPI003B7D275A
MSLKIGIPRSLLYYYYYPLWRVFFEELGAEVVLSSHSAKGILAEGLKNAVDEVCLPVKMFYGHVLDLSGKADMIFLPRIVSVHKREYICPKFLGLPDMIRCLKNLPPLIEVDINLYKNNKDFFSAVTNIGNIFTKNRLEIWQACLKALKVQKKYFKLMQMGLMPSEALAIIEGRVEDKALPEGDELLIVLIGHPYNIYDPYISMDIISRLRSMGAVVATAEHVSEKIIKSNAARLPKKLFWTLGSRMIGAAFHYLEQPDVSGMVHVAAFGCGPDSMTGEIIERYARRAGMPFLSLTLDEHTGEAGILTRLEAFLDMVRWRKAACGY